MNRSPQGLFIGLTTLDVIQLVKRVPESDEKIRALDVSIAAGGPAANAAVAFAALGGDAHFITRFGDDPAGTLVLADLTDNGVTVHNLNSGLGGTETTTASILITESTGDRAVVSAADRGRSKNRSDARPSVPGEGLALLKELDPDVLLVDSYETDISIPVSQKARQSGVPVILDCGGKKSYSEQQLAHVTCAIVSKSYQSAGVGSAAEEIRQLGVPFGAVTDGSSPIEYWSPAFSELQTHAIEPVDAVDTLGAGDFFHGASAYAIATSGLEDSTFSHVLSFASEVATCSIRQFGSRSWLADLRNTVGTG